MLKIYYSSKIENIYWKIYADNIKKSVNYFPDNFTHEDVLNSLTQINLFDISKSEEKVNVINISDWKLNKSEVQTTIRSFKNLKDDIILLLEANTIKTKLFNELKIETIKAPNITKKSKNDLLLYLLTKEKINIDFKIVNMLLDLLPDDVRFIINEIKKIKILGIQTPTAEQIQKIIFDTGDTTIFKVIDAWLSDDTNKVIQELNNLLSGNFDILEIIPMFAFKLVQIKLFLKAKLAKWSSEEITTKLGIPFWLQNSYLSLKPFDKKLIKINDMISKLYNFDINIKKYNINKKDAVPYSQLIKILFE